MHGLACGATGCGKTELLHELGRRAAAKGTPVLVCDPERQEWPEAAWTTTDPRQLLAVMEVNASCFVIVDEAPDVVGVMNTPHELAVRRIVNLRKRGHKVLLATPGWGNLPRPYRRQCDPVYLMRQEAADCTDLARLYRDERLLGLDQLPDFTFYRRQRGVLTGPHTFSPPWRR